MKASVKQLIALEHLKTQFCLLNVGDYGFYSDGSISVFCTDISGEFSATIDINGNIKS